MNYVVVCQDESCVYYAKHNGFCGGFYWFRKGNKEEQAKLDELLKDAITWENSNIRQKRVLGRLGYKLRKDFMQSAEYEFKPYFNKGKAKEK